MWKFVHLIGVVCVVIVISTAGQTVAPTRVVVSQMRAADPFKIEAGSSFSASPAQAAPTRSAYAIDFDHEQLVADFQEALGVVRSRYVDPSSATNAELTKSSISAMLRTLDPHSNYFDANEYRELLDDERSEYSGIGSTIVNYQLTGRTETYILATQPQGPANLAGLRFGDRIVAVNGKSMSGRSSEIVRNEVRGKSGTTVKLTVEHAATGKTDIVEIRRNRVPQPSLPDAYILRQGIGYIDLTNGFNYTTAGELESALKNLHRDGMTSLILDLRGNPGGILDQAVKVAEKFLPAGKVIVSQSGRYRVDNRVWRSANKNPETVPIVLLVDENSASASEVVAGAFQDHDRALIVGAKTFGKGLVQNVLDLPYGAGLTLTAARYFTPSGRSIQRDYSNGSMYEYYNHKGASPRAELERTRAKTDADRDVFGGDGITPDELVRSEKLTPAQISLLDPLFHFASSAVAGRISGLEGFISTARVRPANFNAHAVGTEPADLFIAYLMKSSPQITDRTALDAETEFIRTRLQYNFVMAQSGPAAAARILIENDPQVSKAVEFLPKAAQFAKSSRPDRPIN
ncbi:MAG TPA: S41 family peptidase [Pyrinomonadaceae bacterium]|nr:S41 family peptidase [Pyrinomonadaceae bacterium]